MATKKATKSTTKKQVKEKVVEAIFNDDCNCKDSKEKILKHFPNRRDVAGVSAKDYLFLDNFFTNNPYKVTMAQQLELVETYNRIFLENRKTTQCSPCLKAIVDDLKIVYNLHKIV